MLKVYSEKDGEKSATIETQFYKIDPNLSIKLETDYANQYNAGGNEALIDGIFGTKDFRTGTWQGYWNEDVVATVDLGSVKSINNVKVNFLQDQRSWIFYPTEVACFVSEDSKNFTLVSPKISIDATNPSDKSEIKTIDFSIDDAKARYIKLVAKKLGELPEWHLGHKHDGRSWIFVDEITVE